MTASPDWLSTFLPDRRARTIVAVAGVVGALIGVSGLAEGSSLLGQVVRPPAYAIACMVIVRFTTVVRERLVMPFVAHEIAMAAIALAWLDVGRTFGWVFNGAWLVSAAVWYVVGGRRG